MVGLFSGRGGSVIGLLLGKAEDRRQSMTGREKLMNILNKKAVDHISWTTLVG